MKKRNGVRKIRSIADLAELLGGRENLDAIVRQRLGIGLDEVEGDIGSGAVGPKAV